MRVITLALVVALSACPAGAQDGLTQTRQQQIIDQARALALRYNADLPNFICTQAIVRSSMEKNAKSWKLVDKLVSDLAYSSEKGESYKLLTINDKPTRKKYGEVGGVNSTGDFGTMLKWVFEPKSEATFQWEHSEVLNGRMVQAFSFSVDKPHSQYHMNWNELFKHRNANPGFKGGVYIDAENFRVLRITYSPDPIPPDWSLLSLSSELDYGFADINGQPFFLPLHAELFVGVKDGTRFRNFIDFTDYRKFSSDLILHFEP